MNINADIPKIELDKIVIRHSELEYISKMLFQYRIVLLTGVGGIGKSTLAKTYIECNKENYKAIYWVDYYEFSDPAQELMALINELNAQSGKGVIVVDYVDLKGLGYFSMTFGLLNTNWHVIIISRETINDAQIPILTVGGFTKNESSELIKKEFPKRHNEIFSEFEKNRLFELLDNHPLAITLLISLYKRSTSLTISDVSKELLSKNEFTIGLLDKSIEIYLDTNDLSKIEKTGQAVGGYLSKSNLLIKKKLPVQKGSLFQKMFGKAKDILSSEEFKEKIDQAEHGLKLSTISKQQSEIDMNQAEAVSKILNSISDIENAAIKIGSLLIVKTTASGNPNIAVKNLSIKEMMLLEDEPSLLKNPIDLLENITEKRE